VVVPGIMYLIAWRWKKSPVILALLLGLLANLALHAAVLSAALAIVYTMERLRAVDLRENESRRQLLFGALLLLGLYAFALWTAWPPHDLLLSRVRGQSRSFLGCSIASLVWGLCQPWLLSIPFWGAIAVCLHARRSLFFLFPVVCFACFSGAVYANFWHVGLLTPLVLCLLWITWPAPGGSLSMQEHSGRAALTLLVATQILWSAYAIAYDHAYAYSPDRAAAQFLTPFVRSGASIAVTYLDEPEGNQAFDSVGILPYFDHNIFMNQPMSFWLWSSKNPTEAQFYIALRSRPQLIIAEERTHDKDMWTAAQKTKLELLTKAGYRMTNVFCGSMPERFELRESSCHVVFQYHGLPKSPTSDGAQAPRRTSNQSQDD
jgi:hypothetical protein